MFSTVGFVKVADRVTLWTHPKYPGQFFKRVTSPYAAALFGGVVVFNTTAVSAGVYRSVLRADPVKDRFLEQELRHTNQIALYGKPIRIMNAIQGSAVSYVADLYPAMQSDDVSDWLNNGTMFGATPNNLAALAHVTPCHAIGWTGNAASNFEPNTVDYPGFNLGLGVAGQAPSGSSVPTTGVPADTLLTWRVIPTVQNVRNYMSTLVEKVVVSYKEDLREAMRGALVTELANVPAAPSAVSLFALTRSDLAGRRIGYMARNVTPGKFSYRLSSSSPVWALPSVAGPLFGSADSVENGWMFPRDNDNRTIFRRPGRVDLANYVEVVPGLKPGIHLGAGVLVETAKLLRDFWPAEPEQPYGVVDKEAPQYTDLPAEVVKWVEPAGAEPRVEGTKVSGVRQLSYASGPDLVTEVINWVIRAEARLGGMLDGWDFSTQILPTVDHTDAVQPTLGKAVVTGLTVVAATGYVGKLSAEGVAHKVTAGGKLRFRIQHPGSVTSGTSNTGAYAVEEIYVKAGDVISFVSDLTDFGYGQVYRTLVTVRGATWRVVSEAVGQFSSPQSDNAMRGVVSIDGALFGNPLASGSTPGQPVVLVDAIAPT